jgi:hypothetical protein
MQVTGRDRVLVLILPTLVVVIGYGWFFFRPLQKTLAANTVALRAARAKAPQTLAELAEVQSKLTLEKYQLQRLTAEKSNIRKCWEQAAGGCANAPDRNERIEKLNQLLTRYRLRLVDDSEAEPNGKDAKICPALEHLAQHFSTMSSDQGKPQLRRVHVVGRYLDVLAALEDLAKGQVIAIPVGLTLKEAPLRYASREWVLLVWI